MAVQKTPTPAVEKPAPAPEVKNEEPVRKQAEPQAEAKAEGPVPGPSDLMAQRVQEQASAQKGKKV